MDYKSLEKILNDADVKKSLQEYRASLQDPDEITKRTLQIIYYSNLETYLTDPQKFAVCFGGSHTVYRRFMECIRASSDM